MNYHQEILSDDSIRDLSGVCWTGKVYGACPQVVRGIYRTYPFIWRIRHGVIDFTIALDEDVDPVFPVQGRFFQERDITGRDLGFLPDAEVRASVNAYLLLSQRYIRDLERKV